MAIKKTTVVRVGCLFGFAGIGIALILIGASIFGIDQNVSEFIVTAYNMAFRWLWPASVLLPDYIVGPPDWSLLLARVVAAVLMNGFLYAAIGIGLVLIRSRLAAPKV
jgi:hypothetical protein